MADIHAHCKGCDTPIVEGEFDIVEVNMGKSIESNNTMITDTKWELWYGHLKCLEKALGTSIDQLDLPDDMEKVELYKGLKE